MSTHATAPMASEQERIWRACMLRPDAAYNIASGVRVDGPTNVVAVAQSVEHVMRRHAPLRSHFEEDDARPVVKVAHRSRFPLVVVDLSRLDGRARARWIGRLRHHHAARMVPWDRPPLLAGLFLTWGEPAGYFSCVIHHLVADSWSMVRFFGEFARIYTRFITGREAGLPPIRFGYFEYAGWQRDWMASDACARQRRYWDASLSRRAFRPLWDTGSARAGTGRSSGAIVEIRLPRALRAGLRAVERKYRLTLFMLLEAVLHLVIQKWTGERASRIAAVEASRTLPEAEPLIGPFANLLLLEARHDPAETVAQFLQKVRDVTAKAISNRDYPFGMVLEMLDPGRTTPVESLFQVAFVLQGLDLPSHRSGGLSIAVEDSYNGAAKFPLTVYARDQAGELRLTAEYATSCFDGISVRALLARYATLLQRVSENPEARIADLVALSAAERHSAVHEVNDTAVDAPGPGLLERFEAGAREVPDRIALQSGSFCLTFDRVAQLAAAVGRDLRGNLDDRTECIGTFFERSPEMVVAILGVRSAGCAFLPLNPEHPAAATRRRLETSGAVRVLCRPRDAARVLEMGARPVLMDDTCRLLGPVAAPGPSEAAVHRDAMYVMFTSGSTGEPKGAVVPRTGVDNRIAWMRAFLEVGESDRVLLKTPITFDVSMWEIFLPLASGCTLVLAGAADHRDSRVMAELVIDQQITIVHLVPSMAVAFCEEPAARQCSSLRHVVLSGETLPAPLLDRLRDTVSARIHNLYGPTEASIDVTAWTAGDRAADGSAGRPPIGRPIWNITARVLDERLEPVAPGIDGELYLGGAGVALGYVNAPAITAPAFVPDPFSPVPGARLYRTGDRALVRRDGNLVFLGRRDGQVKVNGVRIELGEIEEALRRHPMVADAAVVALSQETPSSRGAASRIECFAVPKLLLHERLHERLELSDALLRFLREELPFGAAISGVVVLERLPLSPSGKTDRRALAEMIETGGIHAFCGDLLRELEDLSEEEAETLLARAEGTRLA